MTNAADRLLKTDSTVKEGGPRETVVFSYRPDRCPLCRLGYFRGGHQHPDGTRG